MPTRATGTGPHRSVLIVEDDAPLRTVLGHNLERIGLEVTEAGTVAQALAAAADHEPDLMLLDIGLPDHSGWNVLRQLRAAGCTPSTVVISAVPVPPDGLRTFGVTAFLAKPFQIEALLRLVTEGGS